MNRLWQNLAGRVRHPDQAALASLAWELDVDPHTVAHVAACRPCRDAVESMRDTLTADREAAHHDADAQFTASRLERQRAAILRHVTPHPSARVLSFPTRGRVMPTTRGGARRWVAAAAAAGLVVGLWAGRSLYEPRTARMGSRTAPGFASGAPPNGPLASPSEEAFLVELEVAVGSPRIEPLRPLDAMLPSILEAR